MKNLIFFISVCLVGCTSIQPDSIAKENNDDIYFTRLIEVNNWQDAHKGLDVRAEADDENYEAYKALLSDSCGVNEPARELAALPGAILSAIVGSAIKIGVEALDKKIKKELEQYSADYSASITMDTPISKCFRIIRAVREQENGNTPPKARILFDSLFILDRQSNATHVAPLRLIYNEPAPKYRSKGNKYGLALSIEIKEINRSGKVNSYETLVFKRPVVRKEKAHIHYFNQSELPKKCDSTTSEPALYCSKESSEYHIPLLQDNSKITLTAKVAEVGEAPKFLKFLSKVFSGASDDIGGALAGAAAEKISPSDE